MMSAGFVFGSTFIQGVTNIENYHSESHGHRRGFEDMVGWIPTRFVDS